MDTWLGTRGDAASDTPAAAPASASASAAYVDVKREPTAEQRAFIESDFPRDAVVLIDAVAGSGKTTALVKYMQHHRSKRILYLVFNKEAQLEAERTIKKANCTNAHPRTLHALAYEVVRKRREAAGQPPIGTISYPNKAAIVAHVRADPATTAPTHAYLDARGADTAFFEVFKRYLTDMQVVIDEPYVRASLALCTTQIAKRSDAVPAVLHAMRVAWGATSAGALPASQDALAKILFKVSTRIDDSYDVVLCDEAQDISSQFLTTIMRWRGTVPIVFVGDRCQHIYSFLGTSNIFTAAETAPTHRFALSRSFRFGEGVAALARAVTQRALVGDEGRTTRVVVDDVPALVPLRHVAMQEGTTAYLHRTNVGLLLHAAAIAELRPPRRIKLIGNSVKVLEEVDTLVADVHNQPYMIKVKRDSAENDGNESRVKLIDWVKANPAQAAGLSAQLRDRVVTAGRVDALLGTVHAAKGLEWDFVVLGNDLLPDATREYQIEKAGGGGFSGKRKREAAAAADADAETTDTEDAQPRSYPRTTHTPIDEDEHWRLLYVAMTRAKRLLVVSKMLERAIRKRARHFVPINGAALVQTVDTAPGDAAALVAYAEGEYDDGGGGGGGGGGGRAVRARH